MLLSDSLSQHLEKAVQDTLQAIPTQPTAKFCLSLPQPLPLKPRCATLEDKTVLKYLINSAYKDARWFKQPHFHDRVSLDSLDDYFNYKNRQENGGVFIVLQLDPHSYTQLGVELDYIQDMNKDKIQLNKQQHVIVASMYIRRFHATKNEVTWPNISLVSVDPNLQKSGIGRILFQLAFEWIRQDGPAMLKCPRLYQRYSLPSSTLPDFIPIQLEVVNVQEHLLSFYTKLGFEPIGTLSWEDVGCSQSDVNQPCHLILMEKKLDVSCCQSDTLETLSTSRRKRITKSMQNGFYHYNPITGKSEFK